MTHSQGGPIEGVSTSFGRWDGAMAHTPLTSNKGIGNWRTNPERASLLNFQVGLFAGCHCQLQLGGWLALSCPRKLESVYAIEGSCASRQELVAKRGLSSSERHLVSSGFPPPVQHLWNKPTRRLLGNSRGNINVDRWTQSYPDTTVVQACKFCRHFNKEVDIHYKIKVRHACL